ncbi:MAG: hypothetical protein AB7V58_03685 [Solirubrobacterales bacterium]
MHGCDHEGDPGPATNVVLLLEAASRMDALAVRAREQALRALDAEKDYGLMATRLRALATRESVAEERECLAGREDDLPPL